MHDQYYREDDYREESLQKGRLTAKLSIVNEKLEMNDIVFQPIGKEHSWKEKSVSRLHTEEVEEMIMQRS